jgi:hypothetical protein
MRSEVDCREALEEDSDDDSLESRSSQDEN